MYTNFVAEMCGLVTSTFWKTSNRAELLIVFIGCCVKFAWLYFFFMECV